MFERVETLKLVARRQSTLIHSKSYLQTDSIHINTPNLMDLRINQLFNLTWQTLATWPPPPPPPYFLTDWPSSFFVRLPLNCKLPPSILLQTFLNQSWLHQYCFMHIFSRAFKNPLSSHELLPVFFGHAEWLTWNIVCLHSLVLFCWYICN